MKLKVLINIGALFISTISIGQLHVTTQAFGCGGHDLQRKKINISSSLGEPIIFGATEGNFYFNQGFQQFCTGEIINSITLADKVVEIKLFPNPCSSELYFESDAKLSSISLYSLNGNLVFHKKSPLDFSINTSHFENGLYIVQVGLQDGEYFIGKIQILH